MRRQQSAAMNQLIGGERQVREREASERGKRDVRSERARRGKERGKERGEREGEREKERRRDGGERGGENDTTRHRKKKEMKHNFFDSSSQISK